MPEDAIAVISPYITEHINRFGEHSLNLARDIPARLRLHSQTGCIRRMRPNSPFCIDSFAMFRLDNLLTTLIAYPSAHESFHDICFAREFLPFQKCDMSFKLTPVTPNGDLMLGLSWRTTLGGPRAIYVLIVIALCPPLLARSGSAQESSNHAHRKRVRVQRRASKPQQVNSTIELRVSGLLAKMTLAEKLGQLVQYDDSNTGVAADGMDPIVTANPKARNSVNALTLSATGGVGSMVSTVGASRTNLFQRAAVESSRLHIPILFSADVIHGYRTFYPPPLALAATFDPGLVTQLSHMAAEEATTAGLRWVYSPMVDVSRDARWGRTVEGAGEDPYLGAVMARAYVRGYQGESLSKPDSVAAGVKHFAAYGAVEAGREYNTTDMSTSRLYQVYLPPYRAAVEAGAATVMSAFTALNGVPPTANRYLLQDILRDEWGFKGLVVSDWKAIAELQDHGIALDAGSAALKAISAGVDVDMMSHLYDTELDSLVRSGKVPLSVVDEAVRRVLRLKFALGLFEHPYARGKEVTTAVPEHRAMVMHAAEESFVLLQNGQSNKGKPLLPLQDDHQTIALIGPLADDAVDMLDDNTGGGPVRPEVITLKDALTSRTQKFGGNLLYARGTEPAGSSSEGFADAVRIASRANVVVLALGETASMSGEAGSRSNLDLPGNQQQLLEAVAATGRPIVLLVFSGRPLVLTWASQHVPAIMEVWFPGTEAGSALANVLFGDVAPSGKLPLSFPRSVGQEPLYYNQFPTGRPARDADLTPPPAHDSRFLSRYIDIPNDALFPFGYGLSYTRFSYTAVKLSREMLPLRQAQQAGGRTLITAAATVTNGGDRRATETVQCYVGNLGASLEQPMHSLRGFQRVTLDPGESQTITFDLTRADLAFFNAEGKSTVEPTEYHVGIGGSSLTKQSATFRLEP